MSIDDVRILLTIDGEEHEVSHLLIANSLSINESMCNSEYKSTINSASWSIRYEEGIFNLLKDTTEVILVRVLAANGSCLFDGQMEPVFTDDWMIPTKPSPIRLEAVDFTVALDRMISTSVSYPAVVDGSAFYIYRRGYESTSILYQLLDLAGLSDRISIDAPDILDTVVHFSATQGEVTYRALIDPLLAEHLHVISGIHGDGITWMKTAHSLIGSVDLVDETKILASPDAPGFSMKKRYDVHDGVRIRWPRTKVMESALLWRGSLPTGGTEDPLPGEPIAAGDYWPEDTDIVETWMDFETAYLDTDYLSGASRLKNDDLSLIASSDHRIQDSKDDGVVLDPIDESHTVVYESLRARLRYRNNGASALNLYWSEIHGKALIRTNLVKQSYPEGASDPSDYPTSYIYNTQTAQTLLEALWMRHVKGCWDLSWSSLSRYEIGRVVRLTQGTKYDGYALIVSRARSYDFSGIWTYQGVSIHAVQIVDSYVTAGISSGSSHTPLRLLIQYAAMITGDWHSIPTDADYYMRSSSDGGFTWSTAIRIKGEPGEQGEQGEAYVTVVESSNGNIFKPGEVMNTTLRARVLLNGEEVTASIPDSWFSWRRKSFHEPNDDALWNSNHTAGYRTIDVTADNVYARATYFCDIVK